jgi:hypothetical protein
MTRKFSKEAEMTPTLGRKETIMKAKKATKKAEKGKKLGSSKLPKTTLQRAGPGMHKVGMH